MSEYVRKQPLLEILKQESGSPKRMYDTKQGIKWAIEQIESGAFDVPEPTYPTPDAYEAACKALWKHRDKVQRLRAIEQAIRDFTPTKDQQAGYDALVAWLESTTPFRLDLDEEAAHD